MREPLPDISIKADVTAEEFLSRLADVTAEVPDDLGIRLVRDRRYPVAVIDHPNSDLPDDFQVVLRGDEFDESRVWVDPETVAWVLDSPGYDAYVSAVQRCVRPYLSAYNRRFASNRRLSVPSRESLEPNLQRGPNRFFEAFCHRANRAQLHQRSWRDFYSFVVSTHSRDQCLSREELSYLLAKNGFSEYYQERLCVAYEHGWGVLEQLSESQLRRKRQQWAAERKQPASSRAV